ncbi:MmpS family transport accessory protein [Actinocatenispora rupis]|nr:MmpS family transport accessory protein [Actinocatenispora rupis]
MPEIPPTPPTGSPYGQQPPYPPRPPYGGVPMPSPFPPVPPKPPKKKHTTAIVLSVVGGVLAVCIGGSMVAAIAGGSDPTPEEKAAAATATDKAQPAGTTAAAPAKKKSKAASPIPTKPKAKPKVTFEVSGSAPSGVDTMYGTDSDNRQGGDSSPWSTTMTRDDSGNVSYYFLTAQLQGGGDITCKILVDGKAIATGHASGGYNICQAQIVQGWTGGWKKV